MKPTTAALRHLRSNAIAYAALFVALGGSSYAVVAIPDNSISSGQIRKGAVRSRQIRDHAVRAPDIGTGAIRTGQLGSGAVKSDDIADGSVAVVDLGFRPLVPTDQSVLGGWGETNMPVADGPDFTSVQELQLDVPSRAGAAVVEPGRALLEGSVEATNPVDGNGPVDVSIGLLRDGAREGPVLTSTIPEGATLTLPAVFVAQDLGGGAHTFALQAQAQGKGGVTIGGRSLDAVRFGPIFNPPPRVGDIP
ncbi:MAG: hypothetical protein QOG63_1970 [Thermoleophilaceae bacterium]|nr:hypothetical protein [Thermoleophilaceae bacterium]